MRVAQVTQNFLRPFLSSLFFPYLTAHSWRSPFLEVHTQVTNLWGLDGKDFSVLLGGRERFFALSE